MNRYRLTPAAKADLRAIWTYIALDNIEAANRVEGAIYEACSLLARGPQRGHTRKDLTNLPVRFWTLPRYSKYVVINSRICLPKIKKDISACVFASFRPYVGKKLRHQERMVFLCQR